MTDLYLLPSCSKILSVPYVDTVFAFTLSVVLAPIKLVYGNSSSNFKRSNNSIDDDGGFRKASKDVFRDTTTTSTTESLISSSPSSSSSSSSLLVYHPPSDTQSHIIGGAAFICSALADIISAIMNPKKMTRWYSAIEELQSFLNKSGTGDELRQTILKPLFYGRLFDNMNILNRIQPKNYEKRCDHYIQREQQQQQRGLSSKDQKNTTDPTNYYNEIKEGKRMMRFATAAYGTGMIMSALDKKATSHELSTEKKAIAFHTGIESEQDVRLLFVDDSGGSMKVLRHFVAIDRETKSVVLALRGTLSVSGALIDAKAMSCEFCSGKAHKGIAEMANAIWEESGPFILDLFQEEEIRDYQFVVTGHSLGAGAACLLNIKCHFEQLLSERRTIKIKCYGFAPPPTFFWEETSSEKENNKRIQQAMDHTICYIHDNDCVPFLSVASVRRLALLIIMIDNYAESIWFTERFRLFWEIQKIPNIMFDMFDYAEEKFSIDSRNTRDNQKILRMMTKNLTNDVTDFKNNNEITNKNTDTTTTKDIIGKIEEDEEENISPLKLIIPTKRVLWMKKENNAVSNHFQLIPCCPRLIADFNIFICEDMITDHLPEQYEDALDSLCESISGSSNSETM